MRNAIKMSGKFCFKLYLLLALLVPVTVGGVSATPTPTPVASVTTCPTPSILVRSKGSGSIDFGWTAVAGATGYRVFYIRKSDSYTSSPVTTSSTSITLSGLTAGDYYFYFCTVCEDGSSDYVIWDDLII